jgi:L-fuconolactonase
MVAFEIVDAQIGVWEAPTERYPWRAPAPTDGLDMRVRDHMIGRTNSVVQAMAAMAAVGVDAAVLNQSAQYGDDLSYVLDAARSHPQTFASVPRLTPHTPDLLERMSAWRDQPGVVGGRVVLLGAQSVREFRAGAYEPLLTAAERHDLPICVFCPHLLAEVGAIARKYGDLTLIVDHLGLPQPPLMVPDPEPFQALPKLLALAEYPNVSVKLSGAPTLSSEPFPFADVWPALLRLMDAFGPDRLLWASDYARVRDHTYAEALGFVLYSDELSPDDKTAILGRTARRLLRWPKR